FQQESRLPDPADNAVPREVLCIKRARCSEASTPHLGRHHPANGADATPGNVKEGEVVKCRHRPCEEKSVVQRSLHFALTKTHCVDQTDCAGSRAEPAFFGPVGRELRDKRS
ncbi:UNVERIFIED_CONTAM: hypothetical protein GTU68_000284, partial [Idotea baltica]|nr:hypothetical protein [Idotea baltica]